MCSVQQSTADTDGSWSNVVIGVLCVTGLLGFLKVVYDMLSAYWELRVNQAAAKLSHSRSTAPAHDCGLRQVHALDGVDCSDDDGEGLGDATASAVAQSPEDVSAFVDRQTAHVSEPMYVPVGGNEKGATMILPHEVYLFPSGSVYHTEKTCSHVAANARKPLTRRACLKCLDISERRSTSLPVTQRSECTLSG